jgi:hypothetical protein
MGGGGNMKFKITALVFLPLTVMACATIPNATTVGTWPTSRGDTFMLAISAVQGLGYKVTLADKETGIISAEKVKMVGWPARPDTLLVSMTIKDGEPGSSILDLTVSHQPDTGSDTKITAKARDAIINMMFKKK